MNKIMKIVSLLLIGTLTVQAEEEHWGYTCSNAEVLQFTPTNLQIIGTGTATVSVIEKGSIKVDKKANTATVWVTYVAKPLMTENWTRDIGYKYSELGYVKQLKVFNLSTHKYKVLSSTPYKCNGVSLGSIDSDGTWDYVVPGSIDDMLIKSI